MTIAAGRQLSLGTGVAASNLSGGLLQGSGTVILAGTALNDVWILTNANGTGGTPAWTALNPSGTAPAPRRRAVVTYDATGNRLTVLGGDSPCGAVYSDGFVLTGADGVVVSAWTGLSLGNRPCPALTGAAGSYDGAINRLLTFSGLLPDGVPPSPGPAVPDGFLQAPWPNPTSGPLNFSLGSSGRRPVQVDLFDVQGRRVARLLDGVMEPGTREVTWSGRTMAGHRLTPGVYFLHLRLGARVETRQVVVAN